LLAGTDVELRDLVTNEQRRLGPVADLGTMQFVAGHVVTVDEHGRVRRWSTAPPVGTTTPIGAVAAAHTADGRFVVAANYGEVMRRRDGITETVKMLPSVTPTAVAITPDGEVAVVNDHVYRWPVGGELTLVDHFPEPNFTSAIPSVAYAGRVLLVVMHEQLFIWDSPTPRVVDGLPFPGLPDEYEVESRLTVSPDRKLAAVALNSNFPNSVWLIDLEHATKTRLPGAIGRHVAFSPDGRSLATAGTGGGLLVWDTTTRESRRIAEGDVFGQYTAYSPNGKMIALAGRGEVLVAHADGRVQHLPLAGKAATGLRFSPNGTELVITLKERVMVYDLTVDRAFTIPIQAIALSAENGILVADTAVRTFRIADEVPTDLTIFASWLDAQAHRYDPPAR
jgi:WD40 repeat protein